MNSKEKACYILENNQIMTVASSDSSGKPWISPVGFICDDIYNFYWVSSKKALHSQNIRKRPEVAIVVVGRLPEGGLDGVYADALAEELESEQEIIAAMSVLASRAEQPKFVINSLGDVTRNAVWRIYKAKPIAFFKRADAVQHGQAITVRETVEL